MNNFILFFGILMAVGNFATAYVFGKSTIAGFRRMETLYNMEIPHKEPWFSAHVFKRRNAVRLAFVSGLFSINCFSYGLILLHLAFVAWVGVY